MGATILVDELYNSGKELIQKLDKMGINIPAAFLTKSTDDDYSWSIVIAMEGVKQKGSRIYYQQISDIIRSENIDLSLSDIKVVDINDDLIISLRRMLTTDKELSKISFFGNYIDGQRFPDAIIYRSLSA